MDDGHGLCEGEGRGGGAGGFEGRVREGGLLVIMVPPSSQQSPALNVLGDSDDVENQTLLLPPARDNNTPAQQRTNQRSPAWRAIVSAGS